MLVVLIGGLVVLGVGVGIAAAFPAKPLPADTGTISPGQVKVPLFAW